MLFNFSKAELKEGDLLFDKITLLDENGEKLNLDKFRGRWIVIYFYPKDNTSSCTKQAINYSNLIDEFESEEAIVFGVNQDSVKSHKKFKERHDLKIKLLSDVDEVLIKAFGIKVFLGACMRDTVIIDREFKVAKIAKGVSPDADANRVLKFIKGEI